MQLNGLILAEPALLPHKQPGTTSKNTAISPLQELNLQPCDSKIFKDFQIFFLPNFRDFSKTFESNQLLKNCVSTIFTR
jgi:hypothetical protein